MKLHEAVGKRILEYCNERDISPNKLCTMSGIIQSTVTAYFQEEAKILNWQPFNTYVLV